MRLVKVLKNFLKITKWENRNLIRPLIFFSLFFCSYLFIFSQYRIENWSVEQGLPHKTVRGVLQTRDGFIWAATSDGLARFDGLRFTVFNTANSDGLKTNRLEILAETLDGSLWISGEGEGLYRFHNGVFSSFSTSDGLPSNSIISLYPEKSVNRLKILTSKGLSVWENNQITPLENLSRPRPNYTSLFDNTGAFCLKENDILRRHTEDGIIEYKLPEVLPETLLSSVFVDSTGAIWIGLFYTSSLGSSKVYLYKNNQFTIFTAQDGLPNALIQRITEDRNNNIWIAAGKFEEGGLIKVENGKLRIFNKEAGVSGVGFLSLIEDREGAIWTGVSDNGLTRISPQIIKSYTKENSGLSSNNIYPLYEDSDGGIWAGAWRYGSERIGGVDKFENGVFRNFAGENQLTSLAPTSFFQDREGNFWIGALGGLTKYKDGKFIKFTIKNGFNHGAVNAIAQTRDGIIWIATEDGLTKFEDNKFTDFTTKDGLPHADVRNLHESADGTLWLATMGGIGIYKDGLFQKYAEFPAIQVRSIYEDSDKTLWFGTYDAGIFRFKNGEFKNINLKDGLFDQGAFQILEDDSERFWISSNRGIYRVNRQQLNEFAEGKIQTITSVGYNVKDGMGDAECNGGRSPAGFKSKKDGTLWFPTQKGIAVINPKLLPVNTDPPNVVIEYCLVDGQEIPCNNIKILPENETLEIKYTGLSFNKPEQIKFRYMLEGFEEHWLNAGTRRRAVYTHLPPGEYSFKVSAANIDGFWNESGANFKVNVIPPFYRTFWFLILSAIFASAIILIVFNLRIRSLKKRHAAQEEFSKKLIDSQESERQRIATELHDGLGQNLLIIKNWALIALNNGRDSGKQLQEISETASAAIDEVREIAYNLRPFHLDELGLSKALISMIERVSKSSNIEFVWEIDSIDGILPKDSEINFYRIVQECLNNIVKHSKATKADLTIKRTESGNLQLSIWDNGKGFESENASVFRAEQSGFGLAGINERARILGGKLIINSAPNEGTSVKLTVL